MRYHRGVGRGRLQRRPGLNGFSINRFRSVLVRHGLTIGTLLVLSIGFFLFFAPLEQSGGFLRTKMTLLELFDVEHRHLMMLTGLMILMLMTWRWHRAVVNYRLLGWMGYLGLISVAEELVFRFIAPQLLHPILGWAGAIIVSNLVFASLHYVTLRWHWQHCVAAFIGGLGLNQLFEGSGDFAMIVLVHWLFTFWNTPLPPSASALRDSG